MSRAVVLVLWVGMVGCAAPKPVPRPELPPLPRSSIAAVLQQRGELQLTDEQEQKLRARDDALATEDAGLHEPGTPRKHPEGEGGGGGPRLRMGGGHHGGGGGGGSSPRREARIESVQERRDANDTAAFTEIEEWLTEEQRPKAEAIASQFREELYRQREILKRWRQSQGISESGDRP